jgi:hypothetical protein
MKELTETETKISGKTSALLSSLDETEKDLTEYQTNVVNIKQYASGDYILRPLLYLTREFDLIQTVAVD